MFIISYQYLIIIISKSSVFVLVMIAPEARYLRRNTHAQSNVYELIFLDRKMSGAENMEKTILEDVFDSKIPGSSKLKVRCSALG